MGNEGRRERRLNRTRKMKRWETRNRVKVKERRWDEQKRRSKREDVTREKGDVENERKGGRRSVTPGSGNLAITHFQFTANSFKLYLFPNIHPMLQAAPYHLRSRLYIYTQGVSNFMQFLSFAEQYRRDSV